MFSPNRCFPLKSDSICRILPVTIFMAEKSKHNYDESKIKTLSARVFKA